MQTTNTKSRVGVRVASFVLACGLAATAMAQQADVPAAPQATPPASQPSTASQPVPAEGAPQLEFEAMSHDFGTIIDTQVVSFDFKFTNKGSGKLVFTKQPHASCGCTTPQLTKLEYAPGESGVITVSYKPAGRRGAQAQNVTLDTNDPLKQNLKLEIKANIEPVVTIEPLVINFDEVRQGTEAKQVVTVTGRAKDFAATYASVGKFGRFIRPKVLGTEEVDINGQKRQRTTIEYTILPGIPKGQINTQSTIRTTDADSPLASIQILGEVVGDLRLIPQQVNIGVVEPGESFQRTFRIISRSSAPFSITGNEQMSGLAEMMKVDIKPLEATNPGDQLGYEITITGRAPEQAQPLQGNLTLKTTVAGEEAVQIPLRGTVRPKPAMPAAPATTGPAGPALPDVDPAPQPAPDSAPRR